MIQPVPPNCQEIPGFIAPLKTGGWLTKEGTVTHVWQKRGVWDTLEELHAFIDTIPEAHQSA